MKKHELQPIFTELGLFKDSASALKGSPKPSQYKNKRRHWCLCLIEHSKSIAHCWGSTQGNLCRPCSLLILLLLMIGNSVWTSTFSPGSLKPWMQLMWQSSCGKGGCGCLFININGLVLLFSTVRFLMCPQIACLRRGIVTLITFVWLFSIVCQFKGLA